MMRFKKSRSWLVFAVLLALVCLVFTACGDDEDEAFKNPPVAVNVETIVFDGSEIKWDAVPGATSYVLDYNGFKNTVYDNKCTIAVGSTVNDVTVKLIAKNAVGQSEEVGKAFTRLKTINAADMRFDELGLLSWDPVENATGYIVELNGQAVSNGGSVNFSDFIYGQSNTIRIRAVGAANTFSTFGSSVTKTYLGAPSNIQYDGETITWRGSQVAAGYSLYINGNLYDTDLKGSSYIYSATSDSFTIALQSLGDGTSSYASKISDAITCLKLDEVRNITVKDGVLVWDPVEHATRYQVKLNQGAAQQTTECSMKISAGTSYNVQIKPLGEGANFYFSNWSANVNVYILTAPTLQWNSGLSLNGEAQRALYWDNTAEAGGYKVKVVTPSGAEEIYDATTNAPSLSYAYLEAGKYQLSVCATSNEAGRYDSSYSEPLTVWRLSAPKLAGQNAIVSDATNYAAGFTVNFQTAEGANRYEIYREGILLGSTENLTYRVVNVLSENQSAGGEINYKIKSCGNSNGTVIKLDSLTQTEFVVTVLPTPVGVTMEGSTMKWDTVGASATTGYAVKTDSASTTLMTNSHSLQSLAVGEHTISVCAAGNGGNVLASPYSTGINVRKLAAPSNIRVNTQTNEGKLTWDAPSGSKSCKVFFNGDTTGIDAADMENISNYMQQGASGVTVLMQAIADYTDTDGTYILSSGYSQTHTFAKLNSATGAVINGYELTWRAPDNVSATASGKIKYKVYDENNALYATVDNPRLDLSELPGRVQAYSFKILCVGDGEEFFNSDMSSAIAVTKLQDVTLSVSDTRDGYQWNGVANAVKYLVKVNGKTVKEITHDGTRVYTLTSDRFASYMNAPGTYQVSIIAVGNPLTMIMDSAEKNISQTVSRLETPVVSIRYDKDFVSTDGNIVAAVNGVLNANGYKYTFNGVGAGTVDNAALTCTYNAPSAGEYTVIAVATGGKFDENDVFYIDSLQSDARKIRLLGAPSADTVECTAKDNLLTWGPVDGATAETGYKLVLEYLDGTSDTVEKCAYTTYQIPSGKSIKSVKISANGNGATTITSKPVEKVFN